MLVPYDYYEETDDSKYQYKFGAPMKIDKTFSAFEIITKEGNKCVIRNAYEVSCITDMSVEELLKLPVETKTLIQGSDMYVTRVKL